MSETKTLRTPQNLILEDRKKLMVSGVQDVDCFDEGTVILYTNLGKLIIRGSGLHVNALNVDTGEFTMEGEIASLEYAENDKGKNGIFAKLFR